jgi:hypothetical protein
MNQPDKNKRKFTYFEHKNVFATLQLIAKDETSIRGREVTVPELIRKETLVLANKYRRKHGKPEIEYDPSGGKFVPGGPLSAARCEVDLQGNMEVRDRCGNRMRKWKRISQLPQLLSLYRKCKVVYVTHFRNLLDYL